MGKKLPVVNNYYFMLYMIAMFHVKHDDRRLITDFCMKQIKIYVSRETFRL